MTEEHDVKDVSQSFVPSAEGDTLFHGQQVLSGCAVRAAIQILDAAGWQPIETAPKDSTWVLLYVESDDRPMHDEGWSVTIGLNNDGNVGEGEGVGWQFAGWCWSHDHISEVRGTPTHWMPMPYPPPTTKQCDPLEVRNTDQATSTRASASAPVMPLTRGEAYVLAVTLANYLITPSPPEGKTP